MKKISWPVLAISSALLLPACGDDTTENDLAVSGAHDLSAQIDQGGPDLVNADLAGFQTVEGCTPFDYGGVQNGTVAVSPWDPSLGKKCILIRVGGMVSWAASATHPLEATGGTMPSPIPAAPGAKTATTVTFPTPGVYGFQCAVHTSLMHGAVWVIP